MIKTKGTKRAGEDMDVGGMPPSVALQDPMSHQMPVTSSHGRDSQVADEERRSLGNKINLLSGQQLGQLIDLVRDECPKCYEQFNDEECEIDIDSLDRANFDRLMAFVDSC